MNANEKFEVALNDAKKWISDPRNARTRSAIPLRKFLAAVERGEMAGPGDAVAVPFVFPVSPGQTSQAFAWREAWKNPAIRYDLDGVIERLAREQANAGLHFKA